VDAAAAADCGASLLFFVNDELEFVGCGEEDDVPLEIVLDVCAEGCKDDAVPFASLFGVGSVFGCVDWFSLL